MSQADVLVYVLGALATVCAAGVVLSPRTIYSALSLVANMVCLAAMFLVLNAQFLAAVQVIVYAGAVMVLFIFIIALLSPAAEESPLRDPRAVVAVPLVIGAVFVFGFLANNGVTYRKGLPTSTCASEAAAAAAFRGLGAGGTPGCNPFPIHGNADAVQLAQQNQNVGIPGFTSLLFYPEDVNRAGNVQVTGGQLFTTFVLPFEITSLLLLVAAVGAVYLTRRIPGQGEARQEVISVPSARAAGEPLPAGSAAGLPAEVEAR